MKFFTDKCKYCLQPFKSVHKKQLDYQKEMHEMYCKVRKLKEQEVKQNGNN